MKHRELRARNIDYIQKRLDRLAALRHPYFQWDSLSDGFSGYKFGAMAGPSLNLDNLCHELAHAIQFKSVNFSKRISPCGSFHFKTRIKNKSIGSFYEPETTKITHRELETFAIELHLLRMMGVKRRFEVYVDEVREIIHFLPDSWLYKSRVKHDDEKDVDTLLTMYYNAWNEQDILTELQTFFNKIEKRLKRTKRVTEFYAHGKFHA